MAGGAPGAGVDDKVRHTDDAGLAHPASHDGGVTGHAAPRRQDATGDVDAMDILRIGFSPAQDDGLAQSSPRLSIRDSEREPSGDRAG